MKLIVACVVGGLLLLAGPHLLNADHPWVKAPVSSTESTIAGGPEPTTLVQPTLVGPTPTSTTVPTATSTTVLTQTSTSTTLHTADIQEVAFPITQVLPLESPRWRIDYRIDAAKHLTLVITLITFLNRSDQVDQRRAQLVEHKAEALAALSERAGVSANAYPIEWRPGDAASL